MRALYRLSMLVFCLCLCGVVTAQTGKKAQAEKDTWSWNYEMETLSKNSTADYIIKVWSYSKASDIAEEQCKKNAIHGVIFRGVPASVNGRVPGIKAFVNDPVIEEQNKAWFKDFFADGGQYLRFVTVSNSGMADVVKLSKSNITSDKTKNIKYKIGLTVTVKISALRTYLENSGILTSLGGRFD